MHLYQEHFQCCFWSIQLAFGNLFNFVIVFKALLVFQCSNCRLFSTLFKIYLSFFMWLSMSISFEVLFTSSFWVYLKTLMVPKISSISRSVSYHCISSLYFWNMASWFTVFLSYLLISSVKDESSMNCAFSISISVFNLPFSLVAVLKNCSISFVFHLGLDTSHYIYSAKTMFNRV